MISENKDVVNSRRIRLLELAVANAEYELEQWEERKPRYREDGLEEWQQMKAELHMAVAAAMEELQDALREAGDSEVQS